MALSKEIKVNNGYNAYYHNFGRNILRGEYVSLPDESTAYQHDTGVLDNENNPIYETRYTVYNDYWKIDLEVKSYLSREDYLNGYQPVGTPMKISVYILKSDNITEYTIYGAMKTQVNVFNGATDVFEDGQPEI